MNFFLFKRSNYAKLTTLMSLDPLLTMNDGLDDEYFKVTFDVLMKY